MNDREVTVKTIQVSREPITALQEQTHFTELALLYDTDSIGRYLHLRRLLPGRDVAWGGRRQTVETCNVPDASFRVPGLLADGKIFANLTEACSMENLFPSCTESGCDHIPTDQLKSYFKI
ncbi:uncharacterized protein LOC124412729 [Diprion similis]|uniref:uncharacterized protein LOC124412729 n=1 Tax=Diprion similis TaxID=362088 RepID=UPI001EF80D65|nr:uncharacterized protein LOC124412729 [Diprion similis]